MTVATPPLETLADLVKRLGSVPLERIALTPAPGTATESDLLARVEGVEKRLCELVDGVLVEKPVGYYESRVAMVLGFFLEAYLQQNDLGIVLGEAATVRLAPGLVRLPDVSFIAWERFSNRELPPEPMPDLAPDLAVEILSVSNTEAEMARKIHEYFAAGTKQVWLVDPIPWTVRVHTGTEQFTLLTGEQTLDGGSLLPGFQLPLPRWRERVGPKRSR